MAGLKRTGLFEYLAVWSAKRAKGRPYALLVLLCTLTAVASALLDNVTTVLLVAPVTLLVTDRLGLSLSGAKSRIQRGRAMLKEELDRCCTFHFDRRGRLMDCDPKPDRKVCLDCDG